jgi:hypothetical protein
LVIEEWSPGLAWSDSRARLDKSFSFKTKAISVIAACGEPCASCLSLGRNDWFVRVTGITSPEAQNLFPLLNRNKPDSA